MWGRSNPARFSGPSRPRRVDSSKRDTDPPSLRLLNSHDDAEREFDYVAGAENALDRAEKSGWTVVSMKNDWNALFGE